MENSDFEFCILFQLLESQAELELLEEERRRLVQELADQKVVILIENLLELVTALCTVTLLPRFCALSCNKTAYA